MRELVMSLTCPVCKRQLKGDILDLTESEDIKCCGKHMRIKIEWKEQPHIESKPYPTQQRAKRA